MSYTDIVLERLTKLHPKIIDLSLNRVIALLEKLENPQLAIPPVIHIAGTNGKGSTLSFIKAGLEANNQTVHSYTSPHLVSFNERIRLNGRKIDESLLINYLESCESVNRENNITFFEITTCVAFLAFSKHRADYTLLEVGLGGRLDATNVIPSPILSIITPISLDHQQFLGDSILEIAAEKAGIIKPRVPVIVGKQIQEVQEKICSIGRNLNSTISLFGRDWSSKKFRNSMIYEDNDGIIELPAPKLEGLHQIENAGIAIRALKNLQVKETVLTQCLQNVNWPARLQKLRTGPMVTQVKILSYDVELWIDGGHNQAAARALVPFLNQPFNGTSHIILGMLNSKDLESFISEISSFVESIGCISIPESSAALSAEAVFLTTKKFHSNTFIAKSLSIALDNIINQNTLKSDVRILFCGSLYLCGYILRNHK